MLQICKVQGCNQPIVDKKTGLCHKHHYKLITNGAINIREYVDKNKKCSVVGCNRNQQTLKGFCLKHYKQWVKENTTINKKCKICNKKIGHFGWGGLCLRHASSKLRYGDARQVDKNAIRKFKPYGNKGCRYFKTKDGKWVHKEVAEYLLGRKLRKGEIVHHIDLDKLNNCESNIYVYSSNSKHLSIHRQLEQIAGELVRDGIIGFKNGKYYRNI